MVQQLEGVWFFRTCWRPRIFSFITRPIVGDGYSDLQEEDSVDVEIAEDPKARRACKVVVISSP